MNKKMKKKKALKRVKKGNRGLNALLFTQRKIKIITSSMAAFLISRKMEKIKKVKKVIKIIFSDLKLIK